MRYVHSVIIIFALSALSAARGSAVEASPPASVAPLSIKNLSGVWAWRDLTLPAQLIGLLRDYLPRSMRFEDSVRQLAGLSLGSWRPLTARAEGLDLKRGVVLMRGDHGAWRLLIAFQPQRAEVALRELRAMLLLFKPKYLSHMRCTPRAPTGASGGGGWLTCDTPNVIDAPPPAWLSADLERGALWAYIPAPVNISDLYPLERSGVRQRSTLWSSAEFHLGVEGDELSVSAELKAPYHPLVSLLNNVESGDELLSWVHPSSPLDVVFKLTTDELALFEPFQEHFPWVPALMKWIKAGWDGRLLLTFDGGLDHPVLVVGLQEHPWAWEQLTTTLAQAIGAELSESDDGDDAVLTFTEGDEGRWTIPVGRATSHLLIGLYSADLKRRTSGLFSASPGAHLKPLGEPGVSGLFLDPSVLAPDEYRVDPTILLPVLYSVMTGRFSELVDLPHSDRRANELVNSLAQLSEVRRDPLLKWMSESSHIYRQTALPLLLSLHNLTRFGLMVTEGVTLTVRSYLGTLSRLRAELRWRLL